MERNRPVVLFSQRSKLYDERDGRQARALRGSGVAELIRCSSGVVRFLFWDVSKEDVLCQWRVEQHCLAFHPSPKAVHLMAVFASEELALRSKDAFEAAQAAMLVA